MGIEKRFEAILKQNHIDFSDVEIGNPEDPRLARRQEQTVIEKLKQIKEFKNVEIVGVQDYLKRIGKPYTTLNESLIGDIVLIDVKTGRSAFDIEVKVGTNPRFGKSGEYYGAPSLTSICNKVLGKRRDHIPRVILCISNEHDYRVCDPIKMLSWLKSENGWLMASRNPAPDNEWSAMYNGKIRVGGSSKNATTLNRLHSNDYIPSFAIRNDYFRF